MKACLWNVLTLLSHFFSLSALVRFRHETIVCRQTIFYQGFIEITRLKLFMTFLFQEGQKKVCVWGEAAGDSFTTEVREHAHELVETNRDENEMVDVDMEFREAGVHENWWTQHGNMRLGTWGGGGKYSEWWWEIRKEWNSLQGKERGNAGCGKLLCKGQMCFSRRENHFPLDYSDNQC